ncbi:Kunitz/Bovine pancreatic trypsin inhibitor domain protein [Ancylostoma duodenale]|uniref:Kunitz/Bovine pancreatic trypsin inhibitor domain protein n=1 Tax=Ancylostoma duodenale TaxID=51022 RepID=A0A0C2GH30_9BILA|nr:Kunitz/Bovine pancreatic trypsin inhibitor domain protein [Ancylostoma duodenale]
MFGDDAALEYSRILQSTISVPVVRPITDDDAVCTLPLEKGPCFALIPRYGFDAETGTCVMFMYGGCQGNGNNFETMEECQDSCLENTPMPIRRYRLKMLDHL